MQRDYLILLVAVAAVVCCGSGCGGNAEATAPAEPSASSAGDIRLIGADSLITDDMTKHQADIPEIEIAPVDTSGCTATTLKVQTYGRPYSSNGNAFFVGTVQVGHQRRYKYWVQAGKTYAENLHARRWGDDPDLYWSRSSCVTSTNNEGGSIMPATYPDVGAWKAGRTGWMYLAVKGYYGADGYVRYRIGVFLANNQ